MTETSSMDLLDLFSTYGPVLDIVMIPDKSYSFVAFAQESSSLNAFQDIHGRKGIQDRVLYLSFVNKMPENTSGHMDRWSAVWPQGLQLIPDFVTESEAQKLVESLKFEQNMKHRQVQHFGYEFRYDINNISGRGTALPIPPSWTPVLQRCLDQGYIDQLPDQCTVNRYEPGQGIPPHVDTHSCCTNAILSLSLESSVVMEFCGLGKDNELSVVLPERSLLVMTDEVRYAYSHGITPRKNDVVPQSDRSSLTLRRRGTRVSFTFRKTQNGPCDCSFPQFCDSQKDKRITMDDAKAAALEAAHVHHVYEEIAEHFSSTRHSPWPQVLTFIDSLPSGGVMIDVGCGNGKYLGRRPRDLAKLGCDYSLGLLSICRERGFQAIRCDALKLPYKDGIADGCMSIAVIHHLSTPYRRQTMVEEMARVLTPGGRGLIYAWAQDQEKDSQPSTYLKQGGSGKSTVNQQVDAGFPLVLPVHKNRTNFEHADLLVPWKTTDKPTTYHRYYHVFEEGELENLIQSVDGLTIERSYYDQGNWCAVFVKSSQ